MGWDGDSLTILRVISAACFFHISSILHSVIYTSCYNVINFIIDLFLPVKFLAAFGLDAVNFFYNKTYTFLPVRHI